MLLSLEELCSKSLHVFRSCGLNLGLVKTSSLYHSRIAPKNFEPVHLKPWHFSMPPNRLWSNAIFCYCKKTKAWNVCNNFPSRATATFRKLSTMPTNEGVMKSMPMIEWFVALTYKQITNCPSVDEEIREMFVKDGRDLDSIPLLLLSVNITDGIIHDWSCMALIISSLRITDKYRGLRLDAGEWIIFHTGHSYGKHE